MELVVTIFNVGVGLGVFLVGVAALIFAFSLLPLLKDTRGLVNDSRRLVSAADADLRPTIGHARELVSNVEVLSEDVAVKLDRLNDLMTSLQATLEAVRIAAGMGRLPPVPVESSDVPAE
jgi:uncharacterized protein YoxC